MCSAQDSPLHKVIVLFQREDVPTRDANLRKRTRTVQNSTYRTLHSRTIPGPFHYIHTITYRTIPGPFQDHSRTIPGPFQDQNSTYRTVHSEQYIAYARLVFVLFFVLPASPAFIWDPTEPCIRSPTEPYGILKIPTYGALRSPTEPSRSPTYGALKSPTEPLDRALQSPTEAYEANGCLWNQALWSSAKSY